MSSRNLTDPLLDSIAIEVLPREEENPLELATSILSEIVGSVLGRSVDDWLVEPVEKSIEPNDFDLVPPEPDADAEEAVVSVSEAWTVVHALEAHNQVAWADPDFQIVLDDKEEDSAPLPLSDEPVADGDAAGLPYDWSPELIEVPGAWSLNPPNSDGAKFGKGIRIGHPDSGHLEHTELFDPGNDLRNRVLLNLGADFVDGENPPMDSAPISGHGLATSSVIISGDNRSSRIDSVTGVAPEAELVPLRVAKKRRWIKIPTPVLLRGGMRRLKKALYHAVDNGCHVVSISLGWLPNRGVKKAVKYAHQKNVIVCAAAGNKVKIVVWPAAYDETIAVAGCNYRREKWSGSSRGKKVDVTAPAEDVWKASDGTNSDGVGKIAPSSGTSYAVASTAGIAALWLAFHGRDKLLTKYPGVSLTEVFRKVIRDSSDAPPANHDGKYGAGIVNARKALEWQLPSAADAAGGDTVSFQLGDPLEELFEDVDIPGAKERFAGLSGGGEPQADSVGGVFPSRSNEMLFHLICEPSYRDYVFAEDDEQEADSVAAPPVGLLQLDGLSVQLRKDLDS